MAYKKYNSKSNDKIDDHITLLKVKTKQSSRITKNNLHDFIIVIYILTSSKR